MYTHKSNENLISDVTKHITFNDLFDQKDIQRIQDIFSEATGVASMITYPDGIAITQPSNFCRLCQIVRETEKGLANCIKSDAVNCQNISSEIQLKRCVSVGLWDSGVKITMNGIHLANWLIGQVRNEEIDEQKIIEYGDEIGADKKEFLEAFHQVPIMSTEKLLKIFEMLSAFSNELSEKAYSNFQLKIKIEESERINELLQNERLLLRTLIDNIPDPIYAKDLMGKKTLANKAEVDLLGAKSESEVTGKDDSYYYPKEYADQFMANDRQVIQTGTPQLYEEGFIIDGKGKKHWLLSSKLPLRNKDNEIIGVMGIGRDIEARKLVEEALRKSEEFLKETQVIAQLGTYSLDINSEKWTSSELLDSIFGIDADYDRSFDGWVIIIHPEWQSIMKKYVINHVIGKKNKFDRKYKIIRANDQEERWVHGLGKIVYQDQQPKLLIGTIQDITDRVKSEEALKNSQLELKKFASHLQNVREEEKIQLAREIHDELGQILIAIKIDLGMMKQNVLKSIKKDDTENILTNFENLFGLVDNTLNTTRKIMTDLRPEVLYLVGFVEAVKLYVNNFKERYQISCLFENYVPDLKINSQQSVALYRILQESFTNIVKHSRATRVNIFLRLENALLVLEVTDNGIGFKTTQRSKPNSYGLLGIKERVYLLEGKLFILSRPNEGTTIKVEIPYKN